MFVVDLAPFTTTYVAGWSVNWARVGSVVAIVPFLFVGFDVIPQVARDLGFHPARATRLAVIGIVTLNVLTAALVAALAETDLGPIWSAVIVGVVLAILAYGLLRKGMADLKPENLMPVRTVENVQRDANTVKEAYHDA